MSELFFVSPAMTSLATQAGSGLEDFLLRRSDLPADFGVCRFSEPIGRTGDGPFGDLPIRTVVWGVRAGYLNVSVYSDTVDGASHSFPYRLDGLGPLMYEQEMALDLTRTKEKVDLPPWSTGRDVDSPLGWLATLLAAFLLMQQRLPVIERAPRDRAAERRLARAGYEHKPVRVIRLRSQASMTGEGEGSVEYHHRWIVRGHWRNHWHPRQARHVPLWIAPHIKGPEGAPLIGGEKVYAWTR